ncbi:MAG: DUF4465 domain-containing protein [Bacteroidota bacterium]|nr:DUF4465 domain-containing protein [Bacteroidota bacterium]
MKKISLLLVVMLTGIITFGQTIFQENFADEVIPANWDNIDNGTSGQMWQFNNPGNRTFNSSTSSNGFAILDSDNYGSGDGQNADLISPTIDLSTNPTVFLQFEHYFKKYGSSSATLSYSIDNGNSWTELNSWTGTNTENAATYSNDLSDKIGGEAQVKLKWNYTGDYAYYWCIDDIKLYAPANMSLESQTTAQTNCDIVPIGSTNQEVISIQLVANGEINPLEVTKLDFSTTGTTSLSDLTNAKVFYTGNSDAINADSQFGETVVLSEENFSISGNQTLVDGTNYFWLVYDIADNATAGNFVDATCNKFSVSETEYTPVITSPDGHREIKSVVLMPSGDDNNFTVIDETPFFDNGGIGNNYSDDFNGVITFYPGVEGTKVQIDFSSFEIAKYGWNDYLKIYDGNSTNATLIDKFFGIEGESGSNLPETVKSEAQDGSLTIQFISNSSSNYAGWQAIVSNYTPPVMTFVSGTTTQTNNNILKKGLENAEVIGIEIVTDGLASPLKLTDLILSTEGSTANTDIANAKVYYTGASNSFATTNQFGESFASPDGEFTISAEQELVKGTNYFWLAFDISDNATAGNFVDATCNKISVSGTEHTPTTTSPEGNREIKQALSGEYTIAPENGDYSSFTNAISDLTELGVSGAVTFNVASGTYDEYIILPEIIGTSETKTITFKSQSGNNDDVILSYNSGYTEKAIIKLDGADYITFRDMTITTSGTNYATLIIITNEATHNSFINNKIIGVEVTTSGYNNDKHLVYSPQISADEKVNDSYNVFRNNTFENGYIALYLVGKGWQKPNELGLEITGNSFINQYSKSIYLNYQEDMIISGNSFTNDTDAKNGFQAIDAFRIYGGNQIVKNSFDLNFNNNDCVGIEIRPSTATEGDEALIANNFIHLNTNAGYSYGIFVSDDEAKHCNIVNNSVNITGSSVGSAAIFMEDPIQNFNLKNNNFINNAGGYAIRAKSSSASGFESDYNNLYTSGENIAKLGADVYTNLAAWQDVNSYDANSISIDPAYLSASDLHIPQNAALEIATPLSYVTEDIDGDLRDETNPYIGADEFNAPDIEAPIFADNYPAIEEITSESAIVLGKINEHGTLYYVVLTDEATAPTSTQVKAGTDATDTALNNNRKGSAELVENSEASTLISELESLTDYDVYVVAEDNSLNLQDAPVKLDLITLKAPTMVSTFDDIDLAGELFWNGSDETGGFISGNAYFINNYDATYNSWDGFAYSKVTDNTTAGISNQYSAYAGLGVNDSENYGVAYVNSYTGSFPTVSFTNTTEGEIISGFYVTNNTYAALSMLNGDPYAKKFGGEDGNDPDWFKLTIRGIDAEGNYSDSLDFFLADYRFENNSKDYILDEWTWIDLTGLGEIIGLDFKLSSSDNGIFGMNTPAYFCIDDLNGTGTASELIVDAGTDKIINPGESINLNAIVSGGTAPYTYSWTPTESLSDANIYNPYASPITTTEYVLTVTDAQNNTVTDNVTISVNHTLTVRTCNDASITIGSSAKLYATVLGGVAPYSYSWAPAETLDNAGIYNPTATTTVTTEYIVTVTDAENNTATDSVTVYINEPLVVQTGVDQTITYGESKYLVISVSGGVSPYTYSWSPAESLNNATLCNPTATPEITTEYTITVTDSNGNIASDKIVITVIHSTEVEEGEDNEISIYPNPFTNNLNISLNEYTTKNIIIRDVSGNIIFANENFISNKLTVNLNDIPAGIYFVTIISDKEKIVKKIIKM